MSFGEYFLVIIVRSLQELEVLADVKAETKEQSVHANLKQ